MRYIALLRAINVGGRTVRMEALRTIFESLGFTSVETFIASGNVIFDAPASTAANTLEKTIENALEGGLGFDVTTFLRTPAELGAIAGYEPFPASDASRAGAQLYVGFLHVPPPADRAAKLLALAGDTDEFHVHGREFYWRAAKGMGTSKLSNTAIERTLGARATMRNITTVTKLAAKYLSTR